MRQIKQQMQYRLMAHRDWENNRKCLLLVKADVGVVKCSQYLPIPRHNLKRSHVVGHVTERALRHNKLKRLRDRRGKDEPKISSR
jgi:hypothetical protein